ncbi:MAG: hypothetical protein ACXABY_01395 [Candidatus Thorarchaeota archaeon]|jgi:hypothetical protein
MGAGRLLEDTILQGLIEAAVEDGISQEDLTLLLEDKYKIRVCKTHAYLPFIREALGDGNSSDAKDAIIICPFCKEPITEDEVFHAEEEETT